MYHNRGYWVMAPGVHIYINVVGIALFNFIVIIMTYENEYYYLIFIIKSKTRDNRA